MDATDTRDTGVLRLDDYARRIQPKPPRKKRRRWGRKLSKVTAICVHQTAVPGGFGVVQAQMDRASSEDPRELTLELQGLLWRYRKQSYHAVYAPHQRVSVVQWHPKWYTYHGNGSNAYSLGWAYDGAFTRKHRDELDTAGAITSLLHLVSAAELAGCRLQWLEAHRQHSDDRARDPGPEIWSEVVCPVAKATGLEIREHHTTRDGLALPESWASPVLG